MPGDRFAFAVRVGGEDEPVGALYGLGDFFERFAAFGVDVPSHREIIVGQDRAVLGRQVADMPERGKHLIA